MLPNSKTIIIIILVVVIITTVVIVKIYYVLLLYHYLRAHEYACIYIYIYIYLYVYIYMQTICSFPLDHLPPQTKSLQKPGLGSWVTYPVHETTKEVQSQTQKKIPNSWLVCNGTSYKNG